jgi:transposase InsO family protein
MAWAQVHVIRHILIEPGRPMQNGYSESFNGKFRDECLNEHWFQTMSQARAVVAAWRKDFNEVRPPRQSWTHSAGVVRAAASPASCRCCGRPIANSLID